MKKITYIIALLSLVLVTYLSIMYISILDIKSLFSISSMTHNTINKVIDNTINNPTRLLPNRKNEIVSTPVIEVEYPSIYIYNTHQKEKYKTGETVLDAAHYFKEELESRNIKVIVEENDITEFLNINNYSYGSSYKASRFFLEDALKKDSYDLIIDLHRDALSKKNSTIKINDKEYAKTLFVVGKKNNNYKENLELSNELHDLINSKYKISRGVKVKEGSNCNGLYNQDLGSNIILLEIGGNENTYEEVKNTIKVLSDILSEYLNGKKV